MNPLKFTFIILFLLPSCQGIREKRIAKKLIGIDAKYYKWQRRKTTKSYLSKIKEDKVDSIVILYNFDVYGSPSSDLINYYWKKNGRYFCKSFIYRGFLEFESKVMEFDFGRLFLLYDNYKNIKIDAEPETTEPISSHGWGARYTFLVSGDSLSFSTRGINLSSSHPKVLLFRDIRQMNLY